MKEDWTFKGGDERERERERETNGEMIKKIFLIILDYVICGINKIDPLYKKKRFTKDTHPIKNNNFPLGEGKYYFLWVICLI